MKFTLLAATAVTTLAAVAARAEEQYPTPITRPIYSSVPVQDVGGGGAWSKDTVVTGSGGYTQANGAEGMPAAPIAPRAPSAYVQHSPTTGSHS